MFALGNSVSLPADFRSAAVVGRPSSRKGKWLYATLLQEYQDARLQLAEARTHIDRMRFGRNVDLHKRYVIRHLGSAGNAKGEEYQTVPQIGSQSLSSEQQQDHGGSSSVSSLNNASTVALVQLQQQDDLCEQFPIDTADKATQYSVQSFSDMRIVADIEMNEPHNFSPSHHTFSIDTDCQQAARTSTNSSGLQVPGVYCDDAIFDRLNEQPAINCPIRSYVMSIGSSNGSNDSLLVEDSSQYNSPAQQRQHQSLTTCNNSQSSEPGSSYHSSYSQQGPATANSSGTAMYRNDETVDSCRQELHPWTVAVHHQSSSVVQSDSTPIKSPYRFVTSRCSNGENDEVIKVQQVPSSPVFLEDGCGWLNEELISSLSSSDGSSKKIHTLRQQILELTKNVQNNEKSIGYLCNELLNIQRDHSLLAQCVSQIMDKEEKRHSKFALRDEVQFSAM